MQKCSTYDSSVLGDKAWHGRLQILAYSSCTGTVDVSSHRGTDVLSGSLVRHRHHRSSYKACVRVLRLQSTLISNLCTHGVGTKHIPTWWELIPFFYLIIPKSRLIVHKNGVIKKKNGGCSHHPVCPLMFWYQHLLKKCEFVPILSNWLKPYSQAV